MGMLMLVGAMDNDKACIGPRITRNGTYSVTLHRAVTSPSVTNYKNLTLL
jgi:hypothetical protein